MDPEEDEDDEDEEEIDLTNHNEDYVELQNYLSIVGKWRPQSLVNNKIIELEPILKEEEVSIPDFKDFINNNVTVGRSVKEITSLAHRDDITNINAEQSTKLLEAKANIPGYMPLKLLMMGEGFEGQAEVLQKLQNEFHLKIFNVTEISAEMEKIINPPQEEEAQDPKKAKGKAAAEEPQENEEEVKELKEIAEKIKQYRDDNPGIETISEDHLIEILAVKVKYSFEAKTDIEILQKIKEGIKNDTFKPVDEEVDPKKAKGKGPSKEEMEEEMSQYKKVQPSGYLIVNIPQSQEALMWYEKVFNGYTPPEEKPRSEFENSRHTSLKLFPCSIKEQNVYALEQNGNYLLQRSLNLTLDSVTKPLETNKVLLIEKNTPKDLEQKFSVIDENYEEFKNLFEDFGKDSVQIPLRGVIDTTVEKTVPAIEEGQQSREKTPEEVQEEITAMFRKQLKSILEKQQKVLDQIVEENIEVVRQEIEDEKAKAEQEEQQPPEDVKEDTPAPEVQNNEQVEAAGEGEGEQEKNDQPEGEQEPELEEPRIGFHPDVVNHLYSGWKSSEKEYAKNMMQLFRSVRKQNENIGSELENMKNNFKNFLMKQDSKQDRLDSFIESFNKFTDEFPELRPDEQTKDELNNR